MNVNYHRFPNLNLREISESELRSYVLCLHTICFVFKSTDVIFFVSRSTACMINKLRGCGDEDLEPMGIDADSIKQMEDSMDIMGC